MEIVVILTRHNFNVERTLPASISTLRRRNGARFDTRLGRVLVAAGIFDMEMSGQGQVLRLVFLFNRCI